MTQKVTRERLLDEGLALMLERGYGATGILDVLARASAPKGSFYHHFGSKEDFGVAVLRRFHAGQLAAFEAHLGRKDSPPLERVQSLFLATIEAYRAGGCLHGCLIGSFGQELADTSDVFRREVERCLASLAQRLAGTLREAQARGELEASRDVGALADHLIDAWQGALLRMKVRQDAIPLEAFFTYTLTPLLA